MPLLKFSVLTFLGSFPWSLGLAYGGYVLGGNWEHLRGFMRPFDIPILAAIAILAVAYIYLRVRHLQNETRVTRNH